MPKSPKRVLPIDLIDELDDALDLIGAVADLLALAAAANDPAFLKGATISRAAIFIESETCRVRGLLYGAKENQPEPSTRNR